MKKLLVTLLVSCMVFSFAGCGEADAEKVDVEAEVTEEVAKVTENPVDEEPPVEIVEEEPTPEVTETPAPVSYAEEHNIEVIELGDGYSETFTFTEFNKKEDDTPDESYTPQFECPTEVSCEVTDNGDGTKTVTYTAIHDIRDWSLEFNYYSSDTYMVDMASGLIFSKKYEPNKVVVNGETAIVDYQFIDDYDENYTTQTKTFKITCPSDYEDYGLFLSDTDHVNAESSYPNLDDILDKGNFEKRVIIH